jgi:hypothetical protein
MSCLKKRCSKCDEHIIKKPVIGCVFNGCVDFYDFVRVYKKPVSKCNIESHARARCTATQPHSNRHTPECGEYDNSNITTASFEIPVDVAVDVAVGSLSTYLPG